METKKMCKLNCVQRKKEIKFIDLNIDCLEYIFKFLGLIDLLQLAHTNKKLKTAAELAFSWRYRNMEIQLNGFNRRFNRQFHASSTKIVDIIGLGISLQTIRCFGHLIKKLRIAPEESYSHITRCNFIFVIRYVEKYCSKSLCDISIFWIEKDQIGCLEHLKKAFPKVKTVKINDLYVERTRFNKIFPNMESLTYDRFSKVSGLKTIQNHFPNLVHLKIAKFTTFPSVIHREAIATALSLNPQIQILYITYILDMQFIQIIHDCLPNLKQLKIICESKDVMQYKDKVIRFEHVKKLDITLFHCKKRYLEYIPDSQPLPQLRISSFELEELVLDVVFKDVHHNLKKLFLSDKYLSLLSEIDIEYWCRRFNPEFYTRLIKFRS